MIRPTDQETVSTGKTACSSQAPGAGPLRVAEATAGSKGGGGGGRRWGRVLTGLPGEGTAEAGEQTVEIVVGSPGAPGCLQLSGTCLALRAEGPWG